MLKHLFTIIATILVVSSCSRAQQVEGLVYGEWGPGVITIVGDCYTDPDSGDLTINLGTTVQFDDHYEILIVGGTAMYANGTEANPILFTAYPDSPQVAGFWKALIADGTEQEDYAEMTLSNCEIRYGGEAGHGSGSATGPIRCAGYSKVWVSDCYIHHNSGVGVDMDHDDPHSPEATPNYVSVTDSKIESCEAGIKIDYPRDHLENVIDTEVKRTYITDMDYYGMYVHLHESYIAVDIKNNIINDCDEHGVYIQERGGNFVNNVIDDVGDANDEYGIYIFYSGDTDIRNNIIVNTADYAIKNESGTQIAVDYNCYDNYGLHHPGGLEDPVGGNATSGENDIEEDPIFVEGFGEDNYYHLLWNSPCLGEGDETISNNNPAQSISDMGAYGGGLNEGVPYFVGITGGNVSGTLDECGSPYHVLADFTVGYGAEQTLTLEAHDNDPDADCEFLFAENTGMTVYTELNISGDNADEQVVLTWLDEGDMWDGISMTVDSEGDFDRAEILHADYGVCINDADVTLDTCEVKQCDIGVDVQYAPFWIAKSQVSNNAVYGLKLYEASAEIYRNDICYTGTNLNHHGIMALNESNVLGHEGIVSEQSTVNNIYENEGSEIDLQYDSEALLHDGHNNIVDNAGDLMTTSNNSIRILNNVERNWWGSASSPRERFNPDDRFDFDPWDEDENTPDGGYFDLAWLAFCAANGLEMAENYLGAIEAYQGVVEDYPEESVALEAIKRVFYLTDLVDGDFLALLSYYQGIADTCSFTALARAACQLVPRCLVKAHQFQNALDRYEAVIANPPSVADSVFAVIGAGYVYLAAEAAGVGLDAIQPIGIYPELKPLSIQDYRQRCDEALALILTTYDEATKKELFAVMPLGFRLDKPYPNPFNAATSISYSLLDTRDVNLAVYDVLGRKVITLVNDRQDAGDYNVVWSGHSSTGTPVSSGIYFVKMSTETGVQSAKMLLLK
jgi:tetratricopeptide (TPR) repeat protein